jgi:hypothetical protein
VKRRFYLKPVKGNKKTIFIFLVSVLLFNCGGKKIGPETLVRTYVETLIAQEAYSYNLDSLNTRRKRIFEKNNLSEKDFENALKEYQGDQNKWSLFFKRSNEMLDSLKRNGKIN